MVKHVLQVDTAVVEGRIPADPDGVVRPTVQMKIVDAGDLYYTWRWEHALDQPRAIYVGRALVAPALAALAEALPTPLPGERLTTALTRALTRGPLVDRAREIELATALAQALMPGRFAAEINVLLTRGLRPHLRIQPSPSLAQVPWEALHVDEGERLVHLMDVSVLTPATVRNDPARVVSPWAPGGRVVGALDPRVPGFADASELGSVLGPVEPGSPLDRMVDTLGDRLVAGERHSATDAPFRRSDVTREWLESALAGAARFLYVGHVSSSTSAIGAVMHVSCDAATTGHAAPAQGHRPLAAADLVLGHRPGVVAPWKAPNRVALIACESGGELRFAEPTGLTSAFVHGGAEYVTTTRWTLPTDAGWRRFAPTGTLDDDVLAEGLLAASIVAVNTAHDAADPVAALGVWQREQATAWERTGRIEHSPLLWGALATNYAPAPPTLARE